MVKIKLSPNDIRDINNYLTKGLTLPDKYRFILFGQSQKVELLWSGRSQKYENIFLPFQTIESIDEPRPETSNLGTQTKLFELDSRGRQLEGWKNKLIWGDNKYILSSLRSGPLKEEIDVNGGIILKEGHF